MPVIIQGNNRENRVPDRKKKERKRLEEVHYDYDYPGDLNLKPGSELHDMLRDEVLVRANEAYRIMSRRHDEWKSIDRVLKAYVPADAKENEEVPHVILPHSYATLETLLTYFSAAFLQNPIFRYEGVGPSDVYGTEILQRVINLHNRKFYNGLALHTQWRDAFAYGVGAIAPTWEREMGYKTIVEDDGFLSYVRRLFIVTGKERRRSEWTTLFEGNKLVNIDPYNLLPDPNTSAHEIQEGEFFGWIDPTNYMELLRRERTEDDFIFNAQYLRHVTPTTNITTGRGSLSGGRRKLEDLSDSTTPVDVIWMYIDLIPREWKLGPSEYPEKWLIGLGGDEVIVAAMPLGLDHGKIPAAVCAPDYDGYSSDPVSRLGIIHDLQYLADFLYSSHIHNVKKIINDMLVVDPFLINILDVDNPKAGKIIRMRRKAWGKGGIDEAIKQLDVKDVTQNHITDVNILANIIQESSGATDNLKGVMQNRTSRISASEFQGIRSSSLSRMEKAARIVSMQSMMPVADMMAAHTQQLMEKETYIKAVGEWADSLQRRFDVQPERGRVPVDPFDVVVNYDVLAHDGTVPGSEDAEKWFQIFQTMSQQPLLQQQFDIVKVFEHLATQIGAKNIEDFKKKVNNAPRPSVEDDATIEQQLQRGNIRPAVNTNGT